MLDPISHFYQKYNYNSSLIKEIICGARYVAVLLENGNIGLCATLGHEIKCQAPNTINLDNIDHRIILNAYYNALLNYNQSYNDEKDIFEAVDFKQFQNIVMVGNFRPVVKRFQQANIPLYIFDKKEDAEILVEMKNQMDYIKKADAIIITATSIFNQSFVELIENSADNASIFILGPSSLMHPDMLNYKGVKMIFGSVYEPNDIRVLDVVRTDLGTRHFSPFSRKVFI